MGRRFRTNNNVRHSLSQCTFAEDSVLLNNHKNENLNKLLNSISHVCSVYIVGRDDKN